MRTTCSPRLPAAFRNKRRRGLACPATGGPATCGGSRRIHPEWARKERNEPKSFVDDRRRGRRRGVAGRLQRLCPAARLGRLEQRAWGGGGGGGQRHPH